MRIEKAFGKRDGDNERLIGYRIKQGEDSLLIWDDQKGMPGIRIGDRFSPGVSETIRYERVLLTGSDQEEKS